MRLPNGLFLQLRFVGSSPEKAVAAGRLVVPLSELELLAASTIVFGAATAVQVLSRAGS
jgi:hypothetical protein